MAKLSIIVPVFDEEPALGEVIEMLMSVPYPVETEWLFVDDGSSDHSLAIMERLSEKHGFRVVKLGKNSGKGAACVAGIREASGDYIMIQDADFEYDPHDVASLLAPLLEKRADVVYGSRFKQGHQVHRTYHYFVNQLLTFLSNLLSGVYLTDMETCYKVFRADILKSMKLRSKRFGIEVELTAYVAKLRARLFELPISYFPRTHLHGKKISWKDGLAAVFHLVRFNLFTSVESAFDSRLLPAHYLSKLGAPPRAATGSRTDQ